MQGTQTNPACRAACSAMLLLLLHKGCGSNTWSCRVRRYSTGCVWGKSPMMDHNEREASRLAVCWGQNTCSRTAHPQTRLLQPFSRHVARLKVGVQCPCP